MNDSRQSKKSSANKISLGSAFIKAMAFFLAITFVYIVVYIAFGKGYKLHNSAQVASKQTYAANSSNNQTVDSTPTPDDSDTPQAPVVVDLKKKPETVEEIVAYYNTANANVKSKAKSISQVYSNISLYKDTLEIGGGALLESAAKSLMNKYFKENLEVTKFEGTQAINEKFPPSNVTCNLKASDVTSATCVDKGTYYEIEIHAKNETNPQPGYGVGAICNVIKMEDITDATKGIITISNVVCEYEDVYIISNIDKETGNMTYQYNNSPVIFSLTALGMDAKAGIMLEDKWEVQW